MFAIGLPLCCKTGVSIKTNESAEYTGDNLRRTPLHYACMREGELPQLHGCTYHFVNRFKVEHVNNQDKFRRTALHYATINGNKNIMDLLEKKKACVKIRDVFGKTAREYLDMRLVFSLKKAFLRLIPSSSCIATNFRKIPLYVKNCFEDICSDSAQYEAELHSTIRDLRDSVDIISYVRNIYLGCRVDYSEDRFKPVSMSETEKPATTAESTAHSTTIEEIQNHVTKTMEHLANVISSEDDRFACHVVPVGSAQEGTKIGCCDEFDYNFVLVNLSRICKVGYSPESPPGFVLLKASTPDYDEDLFNDNGTLNTRIVKFKFEALVKQILSSSHFCEATGFEFIDRNEENVLPCENVSTKLHTFIKLTAIQPVNGSHVMHHIFIDIVPALQMNDWWPEDARRQDLCQTGECLIVFTQPQNKYPWIG